MAKTPLSQEKRSLQTQARVHHETQRFVSRLNDRYEQTVPVQSGVSAGKNLVQVNGQYYPAEGIDGQGGAVAVVNVGTPAVAKYAPPSNRSVVAMAGTGRGSGPGGGPGTTYSSGSGIDIDGLNAINVKRDPDGAIGVSGSGAILVNTGSGVKILSNAVTLNLAALPGLEYGSGVDAGKVRVKAGDGVAVDGTGVLLNFATDPGMEIGTGGDAHKVRVKVDYGVKRTSAGVGIMLPAFSALVADVSGLYVADSIAGNGLDITPAKILFVGEGDGIDVFANTVAVDVTEIVNYSFGITDDGSNNIRVHLETASGMQFGGAGGVQLGTPSTITLTSTNSVTGTTHSQAIATSNDVGTTPAAAILASTSGGALTLAQLTLKGNLVFAGGDRSITASNNLTIAPSTDLILNPTGNILIPVGRQIITSTYTDSVTGILGMRNWDTGGNVRQLTIGKLKADEMFVRYFTYDEERVNRGAEFWGRSYGYVESDFVVPSIGSTVDVWVEEAPDVGAAKLFLADNWLQLRQVDVSTGITAQLIWFQVVDGDGAGTNDYIARADATAGPPARMARQQWRLKRMSGGVTGATIHKSNLLVDMGKPYSVTTPVPGQGIVHLSALDQDGGPYLEIQTFESVISGVPQFSTRTRLGHLSGYAGQPAGLYGFGGGNDGSLSPSAGFNGILIDQVNGARLFDASLQLYDSGTLELVISKDLGIRMLEADSSIYTNRKYIGWFNDVTDTTLADLTAHITSASAAGSGTHFVRMFKNAHATLADDNVVWLQVQTNAPTSLHPAGPSIQVYRRADAVELTVHDADFHRFFGGILIQPSLVGSHAPDGPVSALHVYEFSSGTGATAGVTIEQDGTGDPVLHWLLSGGQAYSAGPDHSDNSFWKLSRSSDVGTNAILVADTSGNVFIGTNANTTPASRLYVTKSTNNIAADQRVATIDGRTSGTNSAFNLTGLSVVTTPSGSSFALITEVGLDVTVRGGQSSGRPIAGRFNNGDVLVSGRGIFGAVTAPASTLHIFDNNATTTAAIGITVEQAGTGDAKIQFLLTGGTRWGVGAKNSLSDSLVIGTGTDLASSPFVVVTTGGHVAIGATAPGVNVIGTTDITAGRILHIDGGASSAELVLRSDTGAVIDMIGDSGSADENWMQISIGSGFSRFWALDDSGSVIHKIWTMDHSTGYVGFNSSFPTSQFQVETESTIAIRATTYGAFVFPIAVFKSNGTQASPTAIASGDFLGGMVFRGYTSGGWASHDSVEISVFATEDYNGGTGGKSGAQLAIATRPNAAASLAVNRLTINQDGAVAIPYIWNTAVNGTAVQINSNGILTKATSSIRFKKNVRELPGDFGADFVMALKPVIYNNKYGDDAGDYVGFIAEDVFGIGGKPFVSFNDAGLVESLHYDKLTVPLVATAQAHQRRIAELETEMASMKARLYALEGEL